MKGNINDQHVHLCLLWRDRRGAPPWWGSRHPSTHSPNACSTRPAWPPECGSWTWAVEQATSRGSPRRSWARRVRSSVGAFDAVVGRLVLPYVPDATVVLRQAKELLRPGGLMCVHEPDMTYDWVSTPTPSWDQTKQWLLATLTQLGTNTRVGTTLFEAFRSAGLPDPQLLLEAPIGGGARSQAYGWAAAARTAWPVDQELGVAPAGLGVDDLQQRLETEIAERGGSVFGPLMFGAWTRTTTA